MMPTHYLISNQLYPESIAEIQRALEITPLDCVVCEYQDDDYARSFSPVLFRPEAIPGLISGGARFAVVGKFEDGLVGVTAAGKQLLC